MACLIVDDEPAIRRTIAIVLRDMGIPVREAGDGETALAAIAEKPPKAIISDVRLPDMNGAELVRRVRDHEHLRNVPIVLISAYDEPPGHNADLFVSKPFDIEELAATVRERINSSSDS